MLLESTIDNPQSKIKNQKSQIADHIPFPNALSILFFILLAVVYFGRFGDLDYTWQIRTGDEILSTGRLQVADSFSYTIAGQHVPDFEWLYEVTLSVLWHAFGYGGLKLLKTFLITGTLALVAWRLRVARIRPPGIVLVLCAAIAVVCHAWNLRALYCTTIGLLLLSGWLHDHCAGRHQLTWWLPVVMLIWSNIHPGVITGQALLAGAIMWEWLNRWVRLNPRLTRTACWRLTLVGGAGLAATFVTPNPLERMLYPFRPELAHPIMRVFGEMQPLYRFAWEPPYTASLVYLVAAAVGISVVVGFRQYRLWEVALLAGLALLANLAYRSVQDWLLVMLALGIPHLQALSARRNFRPLSSILHPPSSIAQHSALSMPLAFQPFWLVAGLAVLAIISLVPPLAWRVPNRERPETPVAAVTWIDERGLQGNFFAPADYGSYLGWRLGDRAKVYVDTRGFFFPPELLEDCHYLPQMTPDWETRLERVLAYGTDYFLLETTGPRGELWLRLQPYVGEPLYVDEQAVLLTAEQVRKGARALEE